MAKIATVRKDLERRVSAGEWGPGEEMPSRAVLAERYGVSPATVSIAVRDLEKAGLVRIVPSKGMYVGQADTPASKPSQNGCLIGLASDGLPSQEEISRQGVESVMAQPILDGVWQTASDRHQPIVLIPAMKDKVSFDVEGCRSMGVGGLILFGAAWYSQALRLRRQGFPVILGTQSASPTPLNYVDSDIASMLRESVKQFADAGHRRIGAIFTRLSTSEYIQMMKLTFMEALSDRDLPFDINRVWKPVDHIGTSPQYPVAVKQAVKELLSLSDPPTAIFCSTPYIASCVRQAAERKGLSVPGDLSLICYRHTGEAEVGVTGFMPPYHELGCALLEHLLATINDPFYCVQTLIPTKFIDQGTVTTPPVR